MAELFTNFEVNREPRWPIILWLVEGSFAAHLLILICVLYIPGVRDAFNIAALIGETSFVDKPYEKTEIGDEVQLVELSSKKFRYPDGYWALGTQVGTLPPAALPPQVFKPVTAAGSLAAPTPFPLPSPSPGASALPSPVAIQFAQANASPDSSQKPTA